MEMQETRKRNNEPADKSISITITGETNLSPGVIENGKITSNNKDKRKKPLLKNKLFIFTLIGLIVVVIILFISVLFLYPEGREENPVITTYSTDLFNASTPTPSFPTETTNLGGTLPHNPTRYTIDESRLKISTDLIRESTGTPTVTVVEVTTSTTEVEVTTSNTATTWNLPTTSFTEASSTFSRTEKSTTEDFPPFPSMVYEVTSEKQSEEEFIFSGRPSGDYQYDAEE